MSTNLKAWAVKYEDDGIHRFCQLKKPPGLLWAIVEPETAGRKNRSGGTFLAKERDCRAGLRVPRAKRKKPPKRVFLERGRTVRILFKCILSMELFLSVLIVVLHNTIYALLNSFPVLGPLKTSIKSGSLKKGHAIFWGWPINSGHI